MLASRSKFHSDAHYDHLRALLSYQRRDGFWPAVDRDSGPGIWATAVAVNTLIEFSPGDRALRLAIRALLDANPQEAHWLYRLRFRTTDTHVRFDPKKYGWGWVALGATRGQIIQLVLKEAALLVLVGLMSGIVGSLVLGQAAASLLFGISPHDPLHLGAAAIALAAVAAIGSMVPARHASRLDPMDVLRDE